MTNTVSGKTDHGTANTIISIIAAYKGISPDGITLKTTLEEIGLNSLDALTIAFEVEEAFNISIDEGELITLKTISDIVNRVDEIREKE